MIKVFIMYEVDGILYTGDPATMIKVVAVQPLTNYCLQFTFSDGIVKEYDAKPLLELPIFQLLKDKSVFEMVTIDFDIGICCDGDWDVAFETLFMRINL